MNRHCPTQPLFLQVRHLRLRVICFWLDWSTWMFTCWCELPNLFTSASLIPRPLICGDPRNAACESSGVVCRLSCPLPASRDYFCRGSARREARRMPNSRELYSWLHRSRWQRDGTRGRDCRDSAHWFADVGRCCFGRVARLTVFRPRNFQLRVDEFLGQVTFVGSARTAGWRLERQTAQVLTALINGERSPLELSPDDSLLV